MEGQGSQVLYEQRKGSPFGGNAASKHAGMFSAPRWRDLWAAIAFYLQFAIFVAMAVYIFVNASHLGGPQDGLPVDQKTVRYAIITLSGGIITAVGMTVLLVWGMYRAPEPMIHGAFLGSAALYIIFGIAGLVQGSIWGGVIGLLLGGLHLLLYFLWRSRIPFSAIILKTVISCLRIYPAMFAVSAGSVLASIVYLIFYLLFLAALAIIYNQDQSKQTAMTAIFFYSLFSLFWTAQVIENVGRTTVAGVYATFYFLHGTGQTISNPTCASLRRALTYSFGSICFGSLIVGLIQTARTLLSMLFDRDSIAGAIVDCLMGILEGLVTYFNYYAYTQVAIYGKPYIEAASDSWKLIKSRGVDAIINDNLIDTCLSLLILAVGFASGLVAFILSFFIYSYKLEMALATSISIGFCCMLIPLVAFLIIDSGSRTTFVCLAEDPMALQRVNPELYGEIARRYAQITF